MERREPVEASHPQTDQKYLADLIDVSGVLKAPPPLRVQESSSTMSKGVCGFTLQESDYLNASPHHYYARSYTRNEATGYYRKSP
jgi:hypothetical protein